MVEIFSDISWAAFCRIYKRNEVVKNLDNAYDIENTVFHGHICHQNNNTH